MDNRQVSQTLARIADLLEILGEPTYRAVAYRRAANAIDNLTEPVESVLQSGSLLELPGIGQTLAQKIHELVDTGRIEFLEKLESQIPPGVVDLLMISGVGPKMAGRFYRELGIESIEALHEACRKQLIRSMKGLGPKKEQAILQAIEKRMDHQENMLLHEAEALATEIQELLQQVDGVRRLQVTGSLRRRKETIKDLDFVVATDESDAVAEAVRAWPHAQDLTGGEHKLTFRWGGVHQVDIRLVRPAEFASTVLHFTGSKEHNVRLRQRAKQLGMQLSEYGLKNERGEVLRAENEEGMYRLLRLPWIEPELREDAGEIEAAEAGNLPDLIEHADIRGDLHLHTTWSDGRQSILEMARAACQLGYEYIAVADHSQSLVVASGLRLEQLQRQREEIERVNRQLAEESEHPLRVLRSSEVDIKRDGSLDWPDDVLAELDIVVASIHSSMQLESEAQTERLLAAIENPHVDIVAHPSGRVLNRRDGYRLDWGKIFRHAAQYRTALEINASPHRLDLNSQLARQAREYGVLLVIDTDAHHAHEYENMRFGVWTARRAWLRAADVLNTKDLPSLLAWLSSRRQGGT